MIDPAHNDLSVRDDATNHVSRLQWIYAELLRIEQDWTDQLQNQQRRIAAVLAVNGFLLAFLSTSGLQGIGTTAGTGNAGWYKYPYFASLIVLALALMFGVLALLPRLPIFGSQTSPDSKEPGLFGRLKKWFTTTFVPTLPTGFSKDELWLDSRSVWNNFASGDADEGHLRQLCSSVAQNATGNLGHAQTLARRRTWMHWQIALIMVSLGLLIVAVAGWASVST